MKLALPNRGALFLFGFNPRINYEMACKLIVHTISMNAFNAIHIDYMFGLRTKITMVFSSGVLDLAGYLSQPVGGATDCSIGCT